MSKQACLIGDLKTSPAGAEQGLYKLSPPLLYPKYDYDLETEVEHSTEYVVVSAVVAFDTGRPETFIFSADEQGKVIDWGELGGSYRGGMSHEVALKRAGYELSTECSSMLDTTQTSSNDN